MFVEEDFEWLDSCAKQSYRMDNYVGKPPHEAVIRAGNNKAHCIQEYGVVAWNRAYKAVKASL